MAVYKAYSPKTEVMGSSVLVLLNGMGAFKSKGEKILEKYGIINIQPTKWYSMQSYLDAYKEIGASIGVNTLFYIAKKSLPNKEGVIPPTVTNIVKALEYIDVVYHILHRGGEIGHYRLIKTNSNSAIIESSSPYPCEFDKGTILAIVEHFIPKNSFGIKIEHENPNECKNKTGNSCKYIIQW